MGLCSRPARLASFLLVALVLAACQHEEEAPTVTVARDPAPAQRSETESPAEPTGWSEVVPTASAAPAQPVFVGQGVERWRPAIENYTPRVTLGNTTALKAALRPFATYLVAMHNRIHPIFTAVLPALESAFRSAQLDPRTVFTSLEMVIDKRTGTVVRMGVTKTSGFVFLDVAALESVDRAQPFGPAPDVIASPDGNVYVHWEFHPDPFDACTTRNSRPFLLRTAPPP